jgi:hypothetical protein
MRPAQLTSHTAACATRPAGGYSGFFSPFKNITGNYENLQSIAYTYKDSLYLQTATHPTLPVTSSSSSSSSSAANLQGTAADAGSQVGSAAAVSALQRQMVAWSGGYTSYTWQLHLREFENAPVGLNQTVEVFVLIDGVPGTEPLPSSSSSSSSSSSKIAPNSLRLRKDFCGAFSSWRDGAAMVAGKRFSQAVDLTSCMQAAGISPDVPPADPSNAAKGPAAAPISIANLRFVLLSASGEDVTAKVHLGKPAIGWALAVGQQQLLGLAKVGDVSANANDVAAGGIGEAVYSLHQGLVN